MPYAFMEMKLSRDKAYISEHYEPNVYFPIKTEGNIEFVIKDIYSHHYAKSKQSRKRFKQTLKNKKIYSDNLVINIRGHPIDIHKLLFIISEHYGKKISDLNGNEFK